MEIVKIDLPPRFPITNFRLWCGPGATTSKKKPDEKSVKKQKFDFLKPRSKSGGGFWANKQEDDLVTFLSRKPLPLEDAKQILVSRKDNPPVIVNLSEHPRYHSLERQDFDNNKETQWRKRRQRTAWWHSARVLCLSGSRLTDAINMFDGIKFFETWFKTYDPENKMLAEIAASVDAKMQEKSNETMAWGTYHEIDATATFVHHLGETLNFDFFETTLSPVKLPKAAVDNILKPCVWKQREEKTWTDKDDEIWINNFLKDSPDGVGRDRKTGKFFMVEFKCPYGLRLPIAYDKCKYYQYPQKQLHMVADMMVQFRLAKTPEIDFCYLCSWAPDVTRVFKVNRDPEFWKIILPLLVDYHMSGLKKKLPKDTPPPKVTEAITAYCKKQSEKGKLVGKFPSCWSAHRGSELEAAELKKYFPDEKEEAVV
jgi:hypothetical protein